MLATITRGVRSASRSRQRTSRRRPIVSTDGLSRSNGNVSQAGSTTDVVDMLDELGEVVGQLAGHRPRRRGDEQRAMVGQAGKGGDGDRAGDLADRQPGARIAEGARQPRLIAQQRGEIS